MIFYYIGIHIYIFISLLSQKVFDMEEIIRYIYSEKYARYVERLKYFDSLNITKECKYKCEKKCKDICEHEIKLNEISFKKCEHGNDMCECFRVNARELRKIDSNFKKINAITNSNPNMNEMIDNIDENTRASYILFEIFFAGIDYIVSNIDFSEKVENKDAFKKVTDNLKEVRLMEEFMLPINSIYLDNLIPLVDAHGSRSFFYDYLLLYRLSIASEQRDIKRKMEDDKKKKRSRISYYTNEFCNRMKIYGIVNKIVMDLCTPDTYKSNVPYIDIEAYIKKFESNYNENGTVNCNGFIAHYKTMSKVGYQYMNTKLSEKIKTIESLDMKTF